MMEGILGGKQKQVRLVGFEPFADSAHQSLESHLGKVIELGPLKHKIYSGEDQFEIRQHLTVQVTDTVDPLFDDVH